MRKFLILSSLISALAVVPMGIVWAADTDAARNPDSHGRHKTDTTVVGHVRAGMKIYENLCIHCHRLDSKTSIMGAPGLGNDTTLNDIPWIEKWITNPRAFAKVDPKAKALVASNPYGLIMPTFPEMQSAQNRADIIAFLKSLAKKKN